MIVCEPGLCNYSTASTGKLSWKPIGQMNLTKYVCLPIPLLPQQQLQLRRPHARHGRLCGQPPAHPGGAPHARHGPRTHLAQAAHLQGHGGQVQVRGRDGTSQNVSAVGRQQDPNGFISPRFHEAHKNGDYVSAERSVCPGGNF